MDKFSEKSLTALGDYYVYGLIDPRTEKIFYIGKGTGNRVFEHERENLTNPNSENLKLKTISEIKEAGLNIKKIIINSNLSEHEAFAAEAALINAFNYIEKTGLTNIVAGHHSNEALSVDDFEKLYGAEELKERDIKHKILVIKINKLYQRGIDKDVLYDSVRGVWRASINNVRNVDYVFGVYNSLIVAVYKPSEWFICKEAKDKLPRQDMKLTPKTENRVFFVDKNFEAGLPYDENQEFYCGKSISALKINQGAQNPITYIKPKEMMYDTLTKYIPMISNNSIGEWVVDCKDSKDRNTAKRSIQLPFVNYSQLVDEFIGDVYTFVYSHEDMGLNNYQDILEKNGLQWKRDSLINADAKNMNGQCVVAMIFSTIRAEKFHDGILLEFFKNGCILNWLLRLQEIDG